jgi:hypothetical protein
VKQESIPWQSFVFDPVWSSTIRNTSLGPVGQASLPVTSGPGDGDFQLFYRSQGRSVSIQIDKNLALLVIFAQAASDPNQPVRDPSQYGFSPSVSESWPVVERKRSFGGILW